MRLHRLVMGLAVMLAAAAGSAEAGPYTSLYVFGDSYSDAGNLYALTGGVIPASPPYDGRFSNGPVAVEYLAADLGLPFTYSLDPARGGKSLDYAFGGAETGTAPVTGPISLGLLGQVGMFAADVAGHAVSFSPASSLFILEGGGNDLFDRVGTTPPHVIISEAAENIAAEAATLYGLGARHVAVATLFDIGLTPAGLASGDPDGLNLLARLVNAAYASAVATLNATYPGGDFFLLNTGGIVNDLIYNGGFANNNTPCLIGTTACADPQSYVFWDDKHPTTAFDAALGAALAQELVSVPEPGSALLFGSGLLLLGLVRRRAVSVGKAVR